MRLVSSNLANYHASVQKLLISLRQAQINHQEDHFHCTPGPNYINHHNEMYYTLCDCY